MLFHCFSRRFWICLYTMRHISYILQCSECGACQALGPKILLQAMQRERTGAMRPKLQKFIKATLHVAPFKCFQHIQKWTGCECKARFFRDKTLQICPKSGHEMQWPSLGSNAAAFRVQRPAMNLGISWYRMVQDGTGDCQQIV